MPCDVPRTSGPGADSAASGTDGSTHGGNASRRGAVPVSVSRQNTEPDLADLAMLATSLPASLGECRALWAATGQREGDERAS